MYKSELMNVCVRVGDDRWAVVGNTDVISVPMVVLTVSMGVVDWSTTVDVGLIDILDVADVEYSFEGNVIIPSCRFVVADVNSSVETSVSVDDAESLVIIAEYSVDI